MNTSHLPAIAAANRHPIAATLVVGAALLLATGCSRSTSQGQAGIDSPPMSTLPASGPSAQTSTLPPLPATGIASEPAMATTSGGTVSVIASPPASSAPTGVAEPMAPAASSITAGVPPLPRASAPGAEPIGPSTASPSTSDQPRSVAPGASS